MGKNKDIIRYHYNNLNQLLRTYIRQKDYWPHFFEKFDDCDPKDEADIRAIEGVKSVKNDVRIADASNAVPK